MKAFDLKASTKPRDVGIRGQWAPIRLMPDLTTGEVLNAGVVLLDEAHRVHYRLLNHFSGLECLFRDRLATQDIALVMQTIQEALPDTAESFDDIPLPSPHVSLGAPQPARDESADAAVDGLFEGVVTLAAHKSGAESTEERPRSLSNDKARQRVFHRMRERADWVDNYLIAEDWNWLIADPDDVGSDIKKRRTLDMPLRGRKRFGTLLSAVYKSRSTRELHLLRGAVDIEAALRVHKKDRAGFFVMRPAPGTPGFDERTLNDVDNTIDFIVWRLRKDARIHVDVEEEDDNMAERILEWGEV